MKIQHIKRYGIQQNHVKIKVYNNKFIATIKEEPYHKLIERGHVGKK